jgi:hypothetical protein
MQIRLYTTVGCHLCEEALALLRRAQLAGHAFEICEVEIAGSELLSERYGLRIPVISLGGANELGWPFGYEDLLEYIGGVNS